MTDVKQNTEFQGMDDATIAAKYGEGVLKEIQNEQSIQDQEDKATKKDEKKAKKAQHVQTAEQQAVDPQL